MMIQSKPPPISTLAVDIKKKYRPSLSEIIIKNN